MSEEHHELTVLLQCSLAEYGYTEVAEGPADDVPFVVRIMTPAETKQAARGRCGRIAGFYPSATR